MYKITLTEYEERGVKINGTLELVPGGDHPHLFNYLSQTKTWPEMLVVGGVFYAIEDYETMEATYLKTTGFIL